MIISIPNNWEFANKMHSKFLTSKMDAYKEKINKKIKNKKNDSIDTVIIDFLKKVEHLVLSSKKEDLTRSIDIYNSVLTKLNDKDIEIFKKKIKGIFNYNSFVKKTGTWNAYELCKLSKTRTCPYCNQSFAFTYQKGRTGFRPTLDHFYCQKKYPHLALSLYNLIPSCNTCNSTLKGDMDFYEINHLNPFWDEENIMFRLNSTSKKIQAGEQVEYNIKTHCIEITLKNQKCDKSSNTLNTFLLNDRYDFLINEAVDFANLKQLYNESKNTGIVFFNEENEHVILRFDKHQYKTYLLGKMYLDLYENS